MLWNQKKYSIPTRDTWRNTPTLCNEVKPKWWEFFWCSATLGAAKNMTQWMNDTSMMERWLEGVYLQVSERVQQETQRESGLVQQSLSLRDTAQRAPEGPDHNTHRRDTWRKELLKVQSDDRKRIKLRVSGWVSITTRIEPNKCNNSSNSFTWKNDSNMAERFWLWWSGFSHWSK